jgi:hypothetical protein
MNRPERQLAHLEEKIVIKKSRSHKRKTGKKTKRMVAFAAKAKATETQAQATEG